MAGSKRARLQVVHTVLVTPKFHFVVEKTILLPTLFSSLKKNERYQVKQNFFYLSSACKFVEFLLLDVNFYPRENDGDEGQQ